MLHIRAARGVYKLIWQSRRKVNLGPLAGPSHHVPHPRALGQCGARCQTAFKRCEKTYLQNTARWLSATPAMYHSTRAPHAMTVHATELMLAR